MRNEKIEVHKPLQKDELNKGKFIVGRKLEIDNRNYVDESRQIRDISASFVASMSIFNPSKQSDYHMKHTEFLKRNLIYLHIWNYSEHKQ
jgi:hypothetical protein